MDENNGSDLANGATETVTVPEKEVSQAVQVAVHIRPLIIQERIQGCKECVSVTVGEPQIQLGAHCFTFDHVYGSTGSLPANIFEECAVPLVDGLFQGYNATVLAYGQTGSGKTYTMGTGGGDGGIIPQVMQRIFSKVDALKYKTDFQIRVSFIEILKEEIQDLLDPNPVAAVKPEPFSAGVFSVRTVSPGKPPILIRETTNGGITLTGITETDVNTLEEMLSCLEQGSLSRATGSTNMNTHSSRSHAIFTITLEQRRKWDLVDASSEDLGEDFLCAKLHLVDLAGSERVKRTGADGMRFKEGVHINRGLLALGNVISALGDDKKRRDGGHVPYRDSKLTRLLQDSLGGNSRTVMIACISPADINAEETLNTLKYANRARNIQNKPMVNRDPAGAEIQKLRQQLELLQSELLCARASNPSTDEVQILKQKIVWLEASNEQLRRELLQCHEELDAFSHKALDIEADRDSLRAQLEGLGKPATPDKNGEMKGVEKLKDYLARIKGPEQELQTSGSDMTNHSSPTSYVGNGNISEAQPDFLDREPDSEEKVFEHNCLQDSLDKELRELNKQLAQKEAEMKTFVKSDSVVLKQHFERKLVELEEEKQELQKERDKLFTELETITSASDEQTQKMQDSYVEKLKDLEYQISDLKKKQDNQAQLLKQKQRSDEAAKRLQEEICRIKQQKVQLQIKIKQESEQFRTWKAAQEKQLLQLRKEGRRNEYEMHKLRALHQHQKMVLQRKTEEAAIATRRLKELLETKRGSSRDLTTTGGSVATSNFTQNDEKNLQLWLDHELEVAVHMYGLHAAYERQDDAYDRQHDIQDDGVRNREHEICSKELRSYHYIEQNGNTRKFDCQSLLPSAPAKHSRMGFLEAMLNTSSETFASMASQIAETEEDQVAIGHDRWQNVRTIGDSKLLLNLTFNIAAFSRYQLRERELENMELKEKLMDLSEAFRHSESRRSELERQHHLKDQAVAMALAAATKARADIAVKCGVEELSIGFSQLAAVGSTPPHFHYTENCSDYFSKSSGFPYSHKKVPLLDSENVGENGGGSQTGKLWKWKRGQQRWALQFKWKWQKPWRISEWVRHGDESFARVRPSKVLSLLEMT